MAETNSISDEVLIKAQEDINQLLSNKRLPNSERVQLEIQSYFLMFLVSDHKKIQTMYPWIVKQQEKDARRRIWWDRLQWVVIPMGITALVAFIGQAVIFWVNIVPVLSRLK